MMRKKLGITLKLPGFILPLLQHTQKIKLEHWPKPIKTRFAAMPAGISACPSPNPMRPIETITCLALLAALVYLVPILSPGPGEADVRGPARVVGENKTSPSMGATEKAE